MKKLAARTLVRAGRMGFVVAAIALSVVVGRSALVWEEKQIELAPKAGDKEGVAIYRFKNTGSALVTITDVRASCDCTVAELTKRTYAPAETGLLKATFAFADRVGFLEKQITVTTDEPTEKNTTLTLKAVVPDMLRFSTRMLRWRTGGTSEKQAIEVNALEEKKLISLEVKEVTPLDQVSVYAEPVQAGLKYRVVVKPLLVNQSNTTVITMLARFADNTERAVVVFALVR